MKHPLRLVFTVFALVLLAGCAPTLAPHTPYLPMMRSQGEAEAHLVSSPTGRELELQLGYQATSRLVLHTALLCHERPNTGKSFRSVDLGLGYYWPLGDGRWRLGLHGGLAYGRGKSGGSFCFDCDGPFSTFSTRYGYAYVQPTALITQDDFTLGLGVRLGQAHY